MPFTWNKMLVTTYSELVPQYYSEAALKANLARYKDKPYGIKRVQSGGRGRPALILLESLPAHIQQELFHKPEGNYATLLTNLQSKNK